ncbi:MAG: sulfotransferase [Paracoccaceae bacterium]
MAETVLMFGLGATKAGSSWLYRFLRGHPDCHLRAVKELHWFDTLAGNRRKRRIARLTARVAALRAEAEAGTLSVPRRLDDHAALAEAMARGTDADYLGFLNQGRGSRRLVGDITPAYGMLGEDWLARMAGLSSGSRFVYLMRDPLARLWSHVRMLARRDAPSRAAIPAHAAGLMDDVLAGGAQDVLARGDYAGVIGRLSRAVPGSRVFLGFFEELVSGQAVARLCDFLGISRAEAPLDKAVHQGVPLPLDEGRRAAALRLLAPQYETVSARMGRLPAAWEANLSRV